MSPTLYGTVTAQLAVNAPSLVVEVIVAVPPDMPVINPASLTVATLVLELAQVTVVVVALLGVIEAVSWLVAPLETDKEEAFSDMPVTGMIIEIAHVAV